MSPFVSDVHACGECPVFHSDDRNGEWCGHPDGADVRVDSAADKAPRKCPLRKQPLLVQLAASGKEQGE